MKRPLGIALITVATLAATLLAGCSDDDSTTSSDTSSDTSAPSEDTTSSAPEAETVGQFCDAVLAGDQMFSSDAPPDPAAWDAIVEDLEASTPDDVSDETEFVIEKTTAMVQGEAEDAGPSPEYLAKLNDVHAWMGDNCGWTNLEVSAADYAFTGIPEEVEAGKAIIALTNDGDEAHEMVLMRINDDVTDSVEDLVQLPEEEAMSKLTPLGGPFAVPGEVGHSAVELTAGRYAVVCFIPQGTTAENMEAMQTGEETGGQPHAMLGMTDEFVVS